MPYVWRPIVVNNAITPAAENKTKLKEDTTSMTVEKTEIPMKLQAQLVPKRKRESAIEVLTIRLFDYAQLSRGVVLVFCTLYTSLDRIFSNRGLNILFAAKTNVP